MLHFRPPENSMTQDNTPYFGAYIAMWVGLLGGRPTLLHSAWAPAGRKAGSPVSGGWWWEGDPDSWASWALLSRGSLSTWSRQRGGFRLAGPLTCSSGILSRSPKKGIPAEAVLAHRYSRMWDTGPPLDERVPTAC